MKTRLILLLAFAFALSAFTIDTREDITWLNGKWEGIGYQYDISMSWKIKLNCKVDKEIFLINYSSLNCRGNWEVHEIEGNRVIFKEKIGKGKHNCVLEGKVIVTRVNDNYISYSYFEKIDGKEVLTSFSTLKKVGA